MCGIIGYIGNKNQNSAVKFLLDGLKRLEYRGYDSAGIAYFENDKINVVKKVGRLDNFKNFLKTKNIATNMGIGHTRWATHGKPSEINSHPHLSQNGQFAIVHNGIIENYIKLKKNLINRGVTFLSDTDSEVVAQLLEYLHNGNALETIKKTIAEIEGSYALGIVCKDNENEIFVAKKDNPLIIGQGENENYIASDIPAILEKTNRVYRLLDGEIAAISADKIVIYDENLNVLDKEFKIINWNIDSAEKENYNHFMLKEIMEQPNVFSKTISPHVKNNEIILNNIDFSDDYLKNLAKIYIVACGSAHYVGVIAKYIIEILARKSIEVDLASEFRYRNPILNENVLVIIISQSGETADSLAALREAKKSGAKVLSIVNVVESTIACESDCVFYTYAGPEIAVATTKAFSAQLGVIYLLALYFAKKLNNISSEKCNNYVKDLIILPKQIQTILDNKENINDIAKKYYNATNAFFIGRNLDYGICKEGSLKLKEISYIHSEAYAAGELKHGTISLIQEGTLVIAVATQDRLFDKIISNIREVKARGAEILVIAIQDKAEKISEVADSVIYIPKTQNLLAASLAVIPLQLFAYFVALLRGCDIDKPRNLAKSVTVE